MSKFCMFKRLRNWSASSSVDWDKPPFNSIRGQESTMWDIDCYEPQGHKSVAAWFHFFLQAPQWPCVVWKWLSRDHCCRGRLKPGCWIVGSTTRKELTTWADFQFSFHWLLIPNVPGLARKASWMGDRHAESWWCQNKLVNCHEL